MNHFDNRDKTKSKELEEIENDDTPIDEEENPKDDPDVDGHIEDPENKETPEDDKQLNHHADDEPILDDDEEIDEATGEIKKKTVVKPPEKKQLLPDAEERLAEQRREATIINEKNKQLSDAFTKANDIKDPTEDELQQAARTDGFEWDELTSFEKVQYKRNFVNEKKLQILNEVGSKVSNIDAWAGDVDKFLDENEREQTNKALIGKEGAFRSFAMKQSHRGVNMGVLVSAFLHDSGGQQVKKQNGSLMLTKSGGTKVEKKNNLQDADYVATLRKTNPREYNRLAAKGKISIEI